MNKIKMLEKMFPYQVTYLAGKPGEAGAKPYTQKVFAGNENDAASTFNGWFISSKAFPDGSSCRIQKIELIQSEGFQWRSKKAEEYGGWDDWEEIEGLEDAIAGIEGLAYELRNCTRGARTGCKDWQALASHIKGLAANLTDAAKLMAYRRDDEDDESANEAEEPVGELFDALKKALAGKDYKVSQFTSDKEFVGQEKPYDGISIENEDPNAYHKNPCRIVLDTDDNLFRIFFTGVRHKSVTGQPGSISGIVKFILRELNLDESKKKASNSSEGSFTDTFRISYLDEFDPEYSGKEILVKGTGTDRRSAEKDAIKKFYDTNPNAVIHAVR